MKKPDVVMIGLGYIGLPTATLIASKKNHVLGVDINPSIVKKINNGETHIAEPGLDKAVRAVVEGGFLTASTVPTYANTYVIVVPTPFKERNEPDISFVENATKSIIPLLKKGDLLIIESTSPVGTTEKMAALILNSRPELKDKVFIAYCPERVLPGNTMYELVNNDRVIGGIDDASTTKAILFYKRYVSGLLHPTDSKTAELCKLVENSSRDVQIAFANELSIICDKAGVNVWEVINLANKHPRVNILQPGAGVGGHCIAVDPYFITSHFPLEAKIIGEAREINNYKSFWCVEKIKSVELEFELKNGKKPKTALMGVSFKPNIDDLRGSPAKYIVEKILRYSSENKPLVVEPNVKALDMCEIVNPTTAVNEADIVVFLVAHDEFKNLVISPNKVIVDFCGIHNKPQTSIC